MYQGKHVKSAHTKRHVRRKQSTVLLASLALLVTCIVGTTVAYLIDTASPVTNTFAPVQVSCKIEESFENDEKTDVSVKNSSDIPVYIRAAIVVTWKDADGNVRGDKPVPGTHYKIELNEDSWEYLDGYYYYKTPVPAGESTAVLIKSCTPGTEAAPKGYGLNVEIIASAIQADGIGEDVDYKTVWTAAKGSN